MTSHKNTSLFTRIVALVVLLGMLSVPLATVHSDTSYTITGTVVDSEGNTLSGVTLTVYTTSNIVSGSAIIGQYVKTGTTDTDGTFKLSLDRSSYTISLSKPGYQTATLSVNLNYATSYTYDVNKLFMSKSVSLQIAVSTLEIHEGETFSVPVTIKNMGDAETVSITGICGSGYTTAILSQDKQLVQGVYIPASGSTTVSVEVTAPLKATDADLLIKVVGNLETYDTVHLKVFEADGILLSCTYPGKVSMPSDSFTFAVTLKNPYYYTQTFSLDLSTLSNWSLNVENDRSEKINAVTISAGESLSLQVSGNVPYNSTIGDYTFTLKASSNGHTTSIPLTVTVSKASAALTVVSKYPSQSITLGKTTVYPLTISNPGTKQLITLKSEGVPSGWTVAFKTSEGKQINSVLVDSESSESINFEVTPSLSSTQSTQTFTVVATGDYSSGKITLDASIGGSYGLAMAIDSLYFTTNAGSTYSESITLTNTGYSSLNNLQLSITYPSGWTVTSTPIKVTTLDPNKKATFTLSMTAPSGTAAQDYLVQLTATSDEVTTSQQSIRVTVNVESSLSIYGILLLVVAAGAFVLLYKKLRRR
jgi:uncharacterized membrane protein